MNLFASMKLENDEFLMGTPLKLECRPSERFILFNRFGAEQQALAACASDETSERTFRAAMDTNTASARSDKCLEMVAFHVSIVNGRYFHWTRRPQHSNEKQNKNSSTWTAVLWCRKRSSRTSNMNWAFESGGWSL